MKKRALFLIVFIIFITSLIFANNEEVNAIKDSLEYYKKISSKPDYLKLENEYEEGDRVKEDVEGYIFGMIFMGPFYFPCKVLKDDYSETYYFQNYLFSKGDGFMELVGKTWMENIGISAQYVNENTFGYQLNSSLSLLRFSLEITYSNYTKNINNDKEHISALEIITAFTFAQNKYINFRTGLGYQHLNGETKEDGFKCIYKIRLFKKPLNLNLDYGFVLYDLKSVNSLKTINEFNIDLGIHLKRFELKLGYKLFRIIKDKLNGPTLSVIVWF